MTPGRCRQVFLFWFFQLFISAFLLAELFQHCRGVLLSSTPTSGKKALPTQDS
jgi:hypothetical protein